MIALAIGEGLRRDQCQEWRPRWLRSGRVNAAHPTGTITRYRADAGIAEANGSPSTLVLFARDPDEVAPARRRPWLDRDLPGGAAPVKAAISRPPVTGAKRVRRDRVGDAPARPRLRARGAVRATRHPPLIPATRSSRLPIVPLPPAGNCARQRVSAEAEKVVPHPGGTFSSPWWGPMGHWRPPIFGVSCGGQKRSTLPPPISSFHLIRTGAPKRRSITLPIRQGVIIAIPKREYPRRFVRYRFRRHTSVSETADEQSTPEPEDAVIVLSLVALFGLCFVIALGCVKSVRVFRRAGHTTLLIEAERDGVRFHYPTRRCGRAIDVYHPARGIRKAA